MGVKFKKKAPKPSPAAQIAALEEQNQALQAQVEALEGAIAQGLSLYEGDLGDE